MSQKPVLSTNQVTGPKPAQHDLGQNRVKFLDLRKESEMKEGEKRKSALKESASAMSRERSTSPDRVIQSSSPEVPRTVEKRSQTPERIPGEQKGGKSKEKGQGAKGAKGKAPPGKGKGKPWFWRRKSQKGKGKK